MYKIKTTPTFDKDLKKLDFQIAKRIIEKVEWLAGYPDLLRCSMKYMPKELEGLQKYRIGDWRVLFWIDRQKEEIILYSVEHRREMYRNLKRKK